MDHCVTSLRLQAGKVCLGASQCGPHSCDQALTHRAWIRRRHVIPSRINRSPFSRCDDDIRALQSVTLNHLPQVRMKAHSAGRGDQFDALRDAALTHPSLVHVDLVLTFRLAARGNDSNIHGANPTLCGTLDSIDRIDGTRWPGMRGCQRSDKKNQSERRVRHTRHRQDGFVNPGGRPLHDRRLHTSGVPSYNNAPDRRSVKSLRTCKETSHAEVCTMYKQNDSHLVPALHRLIQANGTSPIHPYACQTPNPLSRNAIPTSTSISRAASYGIGL